MLYYETVSITPANGMYNRLDQRLKQLTQEKDELLRQSKEKSTCADSVNAQLDLLLKVHCVVTNSEVFVKGINGILRPQRRFKRRLVTSCRPFCHERQPKNLQRPRALPDLSCSAFGNGARYDICFLFQLTSRATSAHWRDLRLWSYG